MHLRLTFLSGAAALFLAAAAVSAFLTYVMRKAALAFNLVDIPDGKRLHKKTTPLLGGTGFALTLIGFTGAVLLLGRLADHPWVTAMTDKGLHDLLLGIRQVTGKVTGLIISGTMIFCAGLMDDLKEQKPILKLGLQTAAAAILVCVFTIRITLFIHSPLLQTVMTILWIVFILNCFNLIDNADGMCASVGMVIALLCFLLFYRLDNLFVSLYSLALAGTLAGFLVFNFPPARIFMGDAGSSFIGFTLAVIAVLGTYTGQGQPRYPVVAPVLLFGMPIFDTLSVFAIRFSQGKPLLVGDTNHFSHRLMKLGIPPRGVVLLTCFMTAAFAMPALILPDIAQNQALLIMAQSICLFIIIGLFEYYAHKH